MQHRRAVLVSIVSALTASVAASAQVAIDWHTIDGGGGTSSSGCLSITGTIGQWDAAPALSGTGVGVQPGFWNDSVIPPGCPADLNADGIVSTPDLVRFIGRFGSSGSACIEGDFNGDGIVSTPDLVFFIGRFGNVCE
ncbi:MAG: hypothetical protein J0L61_07635 [Planctomycetes bacterium]|nr:hypothetical protein [Planctomycetota bacterium]